MIKTSTHMLSITIPTKNRPHYIKRKLQYYSDIGFDGVICVGDSSDLEHSKSIELFIKQIQNQLNVIYCYYPELGDAETTQKLLDIVSTPYAVWSGDDDFLVPNGFDKCISFLESNHDYHAAHGVAIALNWTNENKVIIEFVIFDQNIKAPVPE